MGYAGVTAIGDSGIHAIAQNYPDVLRGELQNEAWRTAFLAAFKARLDAGKRDAIRLYAEATKLVGGREDLLVMIVRELGVRDQTELSQLVASGRKLRQIADVQPQTMFEDWLECGVTLLREHPECRSTSWTRLGFDSLCRPG